MLNVAARSLAGAHVALEEVLVVEATPRVRLRAHLVLEALVRPLDLEALGAVEVSVVDSVVGEGAAVGLVEAIVGVSVEALVVVVVEVASVAVVVVSATKDRTAMVHRTVLLPVLEDHEVGSVVATAVIVEVTVMAAIVVVVVVVVTGVEEVIEDPAALITNRLAETDTTTATATEVETAMVAETNRENVRTRAIATTTGASAGDTKHRCVLEYTLRWVCHRLLPTLSFYLLRQ